MSTSTHKSARTSMKSKTPFPLSARYGRSHHSPIIARMRLTHLTKHKMGYRESKNIKYELAAKRKLYLEETQSLLKGLQDELDKVKQVGGEEVEKLWLRVKRARENTEDERTTDESDSRDEE